MSSNTTLDRFWTEFARIEPTAELGGIDADKAGYHNTRKRIAQRIAAGIQRDDYSNGRDVVADRRGADDVGAGIDLTMHDRRKMVLYTGRMKAAALRGDVRLWLRGGPTLREFIGTDDGERVYCYVFTGGVPLGVDGDSGPDWGRDASHLWHIHLSVIRQYAEDWEALDAVLSVLKGESLAAWRARTEDAMTPEQLKTLNDTAWQTRNVPAPDGTRKILTGAVGQLVERVLVLEKTVAGIAAASPLTEEQMAEIKAVAEQEAREEVAEALARAADAADDEPQA